ncbi:class I SAM-dependent methyltransferase [Amycolatopsis marina]|nr:class I SAM-dependent methyltransferase [Amycolatopsis marina]
MGLGFGGEISDFYQRYRRGYPDAVPDAIVRKFGLNRDDLALDLGCGTGQLTLPLAERVGHVLGIDPEPDMLHRARSAAIERGVGNVGWLLGSDTDLPALGQLLGRPIGAVTIGQALHWMDHDALFRTLGTWLRAGGGVAVVSNGTPLWLQDAPWSQALRSVLEDWLDTTLTHTCGTDESSRQRYTESLVASGYAVTGTSVEYAGELDLDEIIGGVYSAMSVEQLPAPEQRTVFADKVRAELERHRPYVEHVRVTTLFGRVPE